MGIFEKKASRKNGTEAVVLDRVVRCLAKRKSRYTHGCGISGLITHAMTFRALEPLE